MSNSINYGQLMHQALQGLVAKVLGDVAENGLPGEHHFFITFDTHAPGLDLPDWLRQQYPDDMTIVLQEWFKDLSVDSDGFSVTLNFGDEQVPMYIPFDAIRTFVDPSVEFGLRFEEAEEPPHEDESAAPDPLSTEARGDEDDDATGGATGDATNDAKGDAEVVSLDHFRK